MVREGKLYFKYEDLKSLMNDKKLVFSITLVFFNLMVFQQIADCVRWLSKNRESCISTLYHAFAYVCMLILGYALVISQNYVFMRGIEIDTKNLPTFNHDLAVSTYKYISTFHVANSYGLFREMTGVAGGRPELVI